MVRCGARAIALEIFKDGADRARRRVYAAWDYYKHQPPERRAGFFKFNGMICLSVARWRKFHGLE